MTMQMTAVGKSIVKVSVTKALTAAGDYAAGDVLSESATNGVGTAWTFSGMARANGGKGQILNAWVKCETTNLTPRLALYLFNATPTSELDDNAANTALLHADLSKYVGVIYYQAMAEYGGDSEASPSPTTLFPIQYQCAVADTALYGILITLDAITGETAGDDITVTLEVLE